MPETSQSLSPDPCSPDKADFGFNESAEVVVKCIQAWEKSQPPQPLIMGVVGEWGSGKSVYFNCLKKALGVEEDKSAPPITDNTNFIFGFFMIGTLLWSLPYLNDVKESVIHEIKPVLTLKALTFLTDLSVYQELLCTDNKERTLFFSILMGIFIIFMVYRWIPRLWSMAWEIFASIYDRLNQWLTVSHTPQEDDKPIIIDISPWQYKGKEALIELLFNDIATQLNQKSLKRDSLKAVNRAFKALATAFTKAGGHLSFVTQFMAGVIEDSTSLDTQKEVLKTALDKLKTPIYVFVDDLDRLDYAEVVQVLDFLKSVASLPYMRYIVAYDKAYVLKAVTEQKKLDKADSYKEAKQYLDKILWLEFSLPHVSTEDLWAYLCKEYTNLPIAEQVKPSSDDLKPYRSYLEENNGLEPIRKIKRLLANTLKAHYTLSEAEIPLPALLIWEHDRLNSDKPKTTVADLLSLVRPSQVVENKHAFSYLASIVSPIQYYFEVLKQPSTAQNHHATLKKVLTNCTLTDIKNHFFI
jgi:hypothetical protein